MKSKQNSKLWFILAVSLIILTLAGCTGKQETKKETQKSEHAQTEAQGEFDVQLAGGRLGYKGLVVIGGGASNKLWIIDAKYHKMVTTIEVGGPKKERTDPKFYPNLSDTHAITFTKDFKVMWTANWFNYNQSSYVIAYDPLTFKEIGRVPVGKGAHHTAISPDDRYLYAANQYGGTVSVVDTKTMKKIKDLQVGKGPDYISPTMYWEGKVIDTPYLFVSVDGTNHIAVIDWKKNIVVKTIDVGASQHGVNLTPDGKRVWVANIGAKDVDVLDVNKLEIIKTFELEGNPIHVVFSPDGKSAYVTTTGDLIYKIDTSNYKTIWKVKGKIIPAHLGVSPDGKELWTLNHGLDLDRYPYKLGGVVPNGVQIFDTKDGKLINEIAAESMPHEIQFVPYSAFGVPKKDETVHPHGEGEEIGKLLYDKNCAGCHGADGKGGMGPKLAVKKYSDVNLVANVTRNGKGAGMPAYKKRLKEEEIKTIATYVSTLSK